MFVFTHNQSDYCGMSDLHKGNQNARKYRKGAVRKNVSLDPELVERVAGRGEKLSPLINRLIRKWLNG